MIYRPDIDGLRAIAIIAVVIFHMFPESLTGGFIGVDIFFVISGYLISSILLRDKDLGTLSVKSFYIKRMARILPSFFLMLMLASVVGYGVLLPDEFELMGGHISSSSAFISNFKFAREAGYFSVETDYKPLMHLWSLAIEEQFYLLLPLIFIFFPKRYIKIVPLLLGFSLVASVTLPKGFYYPQSRFWELLLGTLLAMMERSELKGLKSFQNLKSFLGLIFCCLPMFWLNQESVYPGYLALFPTLGAVLIISAGSDGFINKYFLSQRPLVFIGLISYPLYLFHWPALSFGRLVREGILSAGQTFIAIGVALVFSILSYLFIDKKIKALPLQKKKTVAKFMLVVLPMFILLGYLFSSKTISPRSVKYLGRDVQEAPHDWLFPGSLEKASINGVTYWKKEQGRKITLYYGDSNAEQYLPRLTDLQKNDSSNDMIFLTMPGCCPIPGIIDPRTSQECVDMKQALLDLVEDERIERVVVVGSWTSYLNQNEYEKDMQRFKTLIEGLQKRGKKVTLLQSGPKSDKHTPRFIVERGFHRNIFKVNDGTVDLKTYMNEFGYIYQAMTKLAQETQIELIDPIKFLCNESECPYLDQQGHLMYKNKDSLRSSYVQKYVKYLDHTLLNEQP